MNRPTCSSECPNLATTQINGKWFCSAHKFAEQALRKMSNNPTPLPVEQEEFVFKVDPELTELISSIIVATTGGDRGRTFNGTIITEAVEKFQAYIAAQVTAAQERAEEHKLALEWLLSDATGISSKTLCAHMLGVDMGGYRSPPSDADDRSRCIRLLNKIPQWWNRLDELATAEPGRPKSVNGIYDHDDDWAHQIPLMRAEAPQSKEQGELHE